MQKKDVCSVWRRCSDRSNVSKWFAKFRARDFPLEDAPQSGRPDEVDKDQIETLTENNQHYTTREIADILKISKSIKLLVEMKNVFYFTEKNHMNFLANPIFRIL